MKITLNRGAVQAFALDILCVMALVVIGTRNHDTDTGLSGILFVAAPFLIALLGAHLVLNVLGKSTFVAGIWGSTVLFGMLLRNLAFNRGTALAFVLVASVFLAATMWGWRAVVARRHS
ncbi:MAG: DUF3054 family protein [Actinobacteria bacterium]|nr:DUF3054 family protein [Actinomycetota bacterium]